MSVDSASDSALFDLPVSLGLSLSSRMYVPANLLRFASNDGAGIALEYVADIASDLEVIKDYLVQAERARGRSWAEIGGSLGVSAQAAHKRFRHLDTAVVAGGNNLTKTRGYTKRN